ncbi:unnamed protein product [Phytophthora lilii]|uniref:Unnamed protein product n=1 Tax=Phytophthora lilii TaxID=2077276 RepID=A0A9W6TTR2_9STRA|nr:unnamed protein product [Phytophthora lilii]
MHGRKILLLVDNAPGHAEIVLNNVRIHFLPKNTTSHLQPMGAGIIRNFKLKYKRLFVQWVIMQYGAQTKLDLLTSTKFVVDAWRMVSEATIRHCWRHTRIVPGSMSASVEEDSEPSCEAEIGDLDVLISRLTLDDAMSASSYIVIDDNIEESLDSEDASVESSSDSSSDEAEETSFSHAEALAAAQKLHVFMFAHGYQDYSVQKVVDVCRTMAITSKRQTSIPLFFMKHRRFR